MDKGSKSESHQVLRRPSVSFQKLKRKYPADADYDDWGLTPQEQDEKVEQIRLMLVDRGVWGHKIDYYMILRFLRAREYNMEKTLSMFLDHLQWRQENRVDYILEEFHFSEREEFLSIYPQGYHKTDKLGHPVYIQHIGRVDLAKIRDISTDERMMNYHIQEYERCFEYIFPICSKLQNRQIDKSFAILDLKGLGLYHFTGEVRSILAKVMKVDQDNYPETLYHTCIINAPSAFRFIWKIIKPMLNERTQDKIEVCPSDFLSALKVWIDEDNIPEYLGGKSKGTLVDDIGPWNNADLLSELKQSTQKKLPVKEQLMLSSQVSFSSVYQDPETGSSFGSFSSTGPFTSSSRKLQMVEDTNEQIDLVDPPKTCIGLQIENNERTTKPKPLAERILDLEEMMPSQIQRLRNHIPRGTNVKLKNTPKQTLLSRVEVLEEGLSLLISAQEAQWQSKTKEYRSCCGCCNIM